MTESQADTVPARVIHAQEPTIQASSPSTLAPKVEAPVTKAPKAELASQAQQPDHIAPLNALLINALSSGRPPHVCDRPGFHARVWRQRPLVGYAFMLITQNGDRPSEHLASLVIKCT